MHIGLGSALASREQSNRHSSARSKPSSGLAMSEPGLTTSGLFVIKVEANKANEHAHPLKGDALLFAERNLTMFANVRVRVLEGSPGFAATSNVCWSFRQSRVCERSDTDARSDALSDPMSDFRLSGVRATAGLGRAGGWARSGLVNWAECFAAQVRRPHHAT
jgi:hypothetical protein